MDFRIGEVGSLSGRSRWSGLSGISRLSVWKVCTFCVESRHFKLER